MSLLLPTLRALAALLAGLPTAPAAGPPARPPLIRAADDGGTRVGVDVRYYEVAGRSEADLLRAMLRQGPSWEGRRFFGLTTSEVRFSYVRVPGPPVCALRDIVVEARVTITLPRWVPPAGTPYALERDWRHFERALRDHEDIHRRLIEEEAEMLRRMLLALRAPSCEAMDAEARRTAEVVRDRYVARHHAYDERTGHGRTQGANWPLGR